MIFVPPKYHRRETHIYQKTYIAAITILALSLVIVSVLNGCAPSETSQLKVVAGSADIYFVVDRVGGDKVELSILAPGGECPGHYDVKPQDVQKVADGGLFLIHDWQPDFVNIQRLIQAAEAENTELLVREITAEDNWMVPTAEADAIEKIATILSEVDPDNKAYYESNAARMKASVLAKGEELKGKLEAEGIGGAKVFCSMYNENLLEWAGFEVIAIYPPDPEKLTSKKLKELIDLGKEAEIALVIDKVQRGPETGLEMADEIGAVHVVLSMRPSGFEGIDTWEETAEENVKRLLTGLQQYRRKQ